jgi:holliday junction DNA helicase RuvA
VIGLLTGTVIEIEGNLALLDVQGVGYEVTVPDSVIGKLAPKSSATLYTRQIFREDGVFLCGFLDRNDRRIFDLLLDVKGCGPKVAQALIGQVGPDAISSSIVGNDPRTLARATGVGQRLAERIILELRPKIELANLVIGGGAAVATPVPSADRDLIDALMSLGYRRQEAEQAAAKTDSNLTTDQRLKSALLVLKK